MNATGNTPASGSGRGDTASGRGSTILVLGILSLVVCAFIGPFAWMMGKEDLEKMDQGLMDDSDRGMTKAGMICGIVSSVFLAVGAVFFVIALVLQMSGVLLVGL